MIQKFKKYGLEGLIRTRITAFNFVNADDNIVA